MVARSEKLQWNMPLLLPSVLDARDACALRLVEALRVRSGVGEVHVLPAAEEAPPRLCVHYDPDALTAERMQELVKRESQGLSNRYGHVVWQPQGPLRARDSEVVARHLRRLGGVLAAEVRPQGSIALEFDRRATTETVLRREFGAVEAGLRGPMPPAMEDENQERQAGSIAPSRPEGHEPVPTRPQGESKAKEHDHKHDHDDGHGAEMAFAGLAGATLAAAYALDTFAAVAHQQEALGLYIAAYFFGGVFTLKETIAAIRAGRFEIDFLMLVAAAGAATLGAWAEGALLLFLFSVGHALEHYAMGRAQRAIAALGELAPRTALVRRNGETEEVPVESLRPGDVVVVKPDERIPSDGFVVAGRSSVNQAPITGESVPVDKSPVDDRDAAARAPDRVDKKAHRVFAGTINGSGALDVYVTRRAEDTTLARVVRMVKEAEAQKSPTQRFTERFARWFVPAVLGGVGLLLFAWVVVDEPFSASFYRAMAVLVAASPCALAIAIPSAVLSGVGRAARGGVLAKGGGPLEHLGALGAIAFDKTGTLTEGRPRVTELAPADGAGVDELLRVAAAVEALSDHPLAAAVVSHAQQRLGDMPLPEAHDLRTLTGRGVEATVESEVVHVGKAELFDEVDGAPLPETLRRRVREMEEAGCTTMVVRYGGRYLGAIGLMDTPRPSARKVLADLRKLGIRHQIMISGDNQRVADAVARQLGIDEAFGDLLPEQKVETIERLRRHEHFAMVGDGVNDAPAMAHATLGIAMGAAGSDVALETADVALMADDLERLPFAVSLSRATSRIIRQNLWASLGVVALLVPATILGLGIGPAVMVHEGSTLLVVFNALRLLAFKG